MTDEKKQAIRTRFGRRVTALRDMNGWTITELADRAGLGRGHVSRIEKGEYAVTLETASAIAEAFGMAFDIVDPRLTDLGPLKMLTE